MNNIYKKITKSLVSRTLSMLDRNPLSSTYGCFDRNFWHLKTLVDFPSTTYQQPVLGLALFYSTKNKDNSYYKKEKLADFIKAGILFWCKIQKKDGSFDEYYENEFSFCPTAYTTYAVAKAFYLTANLFSFKEKKQISDCLIKSALWLGRHKNTLVSNQMIVSMNALYWVGKITKNNKILKAFKKRRLDVLKSQTKEGWFPEYGGADIGYSFLSLDTLADYIKVSNDKEIKTAVLKLLNFLIFFLHPDGTCGGAYASRSTQHIFPFGLEHLANQNIKTAKYILSWFREHYLKANLIQPGVIDDKYFNYFYFNSYVQAFFEYKSEHFEYKSEYKEERALSLDNQYKLSKAKIFDKAGLIAINNGFVSAWISIYRKGVCEIFYNNKLIYSDCGYLVELSNKIKAASQTQNKKIEYNIFNKKGGSIEIKIKGKLSKIDDSLPLINWLIPFKLFCKTLLRWRKFAYFFNNQLKYKKIVKSYCLPITINRQFRFLKNRLIIKDILTIDRSYLATFKNIKLVHHVTTVHSPSSRYYQAQYLFPKFKPVLEKKSKKSCIFEYQIVYR